MANRDGSKSGGRKKGTPNKDTAEAQEIADRLGIDPFEVMLRFAANDWKGLGYKKGTKKFFGQVVPVISLELRAHMAFSATKFLRPQRKAIELRGEKESGPITITFVEAKK